MDDKQLSAQEADELFQHMAIQREFEAHRRKQNGVAIRREAEVALMEMALRSCLQDVKSGGRISTATELLLRAALGEFL